MPKALSMTEQALAWCFLNRAATARLTGSLYGVMSAMGRDIDRDIHHPPEYNSLQVDTVSGYRKSYF